MTRYRRHLVRDPDVAHDETDDAAQIAAALATHGIRFDRWSATSALGPDSSDEDIVAAHRADIDDLARACGQANVVVERIAPEEGSPQLRAKFLAEHFHDEDEIWYFVDGRSDFYLHLDDQVLSVSCAAGDLLHLPSGTRHWFDMGPEPRFTAIRFYRTPDSGFVATFTGDPLADRVPRLADSAA